MDLVIHEQTEHAVESFIRHPSHALVLIGDAGIGKTTIAHLIASRLLNIPIDRVEANPAIKQIYPNEKGSVIIEFIHEINNFLRLKTFGQYAVKRIAIINGAHGMTTEAQNALLKILEEPPADTVLILCADQLDALLPTIRSRCQTISIMRPSEQQLREHFKNSSENEALLHRSIVMSDQLPGLLNAMLRDESAHPLVEAIAQAKSFLADSRYGRLALINRISKDRDEVTRLLQALQRITQAALSQSGIAEKNTATKQWLYRLEIISDALTDLRHNPSLKLLLTNLALHL